MKAMKAVNAKEIRSLEIKLIQPDTILDFILSTFQNVHCFYWKLLLLILHKDLLSSSQEILQDIQTPSLQIQPQCKIHQQMGLSC